GTRAAPGQPSAATRPRSRRSRDQPPQLLEQPVEPLGLTGPIVPPRILRAACAGAVQNVLGSGGVPPAVERAAESDQGRLRLRHVPRGGTSSRARAIRADCASGTCPAAAR